MCVHLQGGSARNFQKCPVSVPALAHVLPRAVPVHTQLAICRVLFSNPDAIGQVRHTAVERVMGNGGADDDGGVDDDGYGRVGTISGHGRRSEFTHDDCGSGASHGMVLPAAPQACHTSAHSHAPPRTQAMLTAFGYYIDITRTNSKGNTCLHLACLRYDQQPHRRYSLVFVGSGYCLWCLQVERRGVRNHPALAVPGRTFGGDKPRWRNSTALLRSVNPPPCLKHTYALHMALAYSNAFLFLSSPWLVPTVTMGSSPVVAMLVEAGASINARNYNDQTPVDVANARGLGLPCVMLG